MGPDRFEDIEHLFDTITNGKEFPSKVAVMSQDVDEVNKLLLSAGFQIKLSPVSSMSSEETLRSSITALRGVLSSLKKSDMSVDSIVDQVKKATEEVSSLKRSYKQVSKKADIAHRKLAELDMNLEQINGANTESVNLLKKEVMEQRVTRSNLMQREKQFKLESQDKRKKLEAATDMLKSLSNAPKNKQGPKPSISMNKQFPGAPMPMPETDVISDIMDRLRSVEDDLSFQNEEIQDLIVRIRDGLSQICSGNLSDYTNSSDSIFDEPQEEENVDDQEDMLSQIRSSVEHLHTLILANRSQRTTLPEVSEVPAELHLTTENTENNGELAVE